MTTAERLMIEAGALRDAASLLEFETAFVETRAVAQCMNEDAKFLRQIADAKERQAGNGTP